MKKKKHTHTWVLETYASRVGEQSTSRVMVFLLES